MIPATQKQIGYIIGLGKKHDLEYSSSDFKDEYGNINLTKAEANRMIRSLKGQPDPEKYKKVRGKIIHYLCLLGYTDDAGEADFERIDPFIQNIGSRNPDRLELQDLDGKQLTAVLYQVEAIYKKESSKV